MTASTQTLHTLLERAQELRDAAQLALQQLLQQAGAAEAQTQRLTAYRGEYQQRWNAQFARSGAIEIVHCYQGFMTRLEQAVAQQQRIASHLQNQVDAARAALTEHELRVASVRKLIERRRVEREQVMQRHEQKQTDEAAQRAAWNGNTARMSALWI